MKITRYPLGDLLANGYMIRWENSDKCIFIDPGGPVLDVLRDIARDNLKIEWIICTHGHGDHIAGVNQLKEATGARILIHEDDSECLPDPSKNLSMWMGKPFSCKEADELIHGEEVLYFFDLAIMNVIHTPGHTPGSISLLLKDLKTGEIVLFSGDTLFAGSIGRTDLPGGDMAEIESSLETLSKLDNVIRVLPGHGPETTIGNEKKSNPYWPRHKF